MSKIGKKTKELLERKIHGKKKQNRLSPTYISGTAGTIYFRFSMSSLPMCWHLHSEIGLVWSKDHRAMNACNIIILCSLC